MKEKWFEYLKQNKSWWTSGMTLNRLDKVKDFVLSDQYIISDLLLRHGGDKQTPEEMKINNKETFEHCMSNFAINIFDKMVETKIYKIK